ncbi:hypothetical protein NPX13_g8936 [Xylaria arbuscula]|uniref:RCHY1 zinc-ribbon domain-containing protein n=1 Tax=Xylaria arbuscula TaxID=114810 RepID=A0A9W8N7B7_9PEZI|nr:hypothetical protein NPX13_g8936 [Xylaria arbuscula]
MTSLVADLLVNPVLRQARRFSLSRSSNPPEPDPTLRTVQTYMQSHDDDDVISETEGCSSLRDDPEDSVFSRRSSRSSALIPANTDVGRVGDRCSQPEDSVVPTASGTSANHVHVSELRSNLLPSNDFTMSTAASLSSPLTGGVVQQHSPLPEDDGMSLLRRRILAIQAKDIDHSEKAHLMHKLLSEGYMKSQSHEQSLPPSSPGSSGKRASQSHGPLESFKFWQNALDEAENAESFGLTDKDLEPTFVPVKESPESIIAGDDIVGFDDERLLGFDGIPVDFAMIMPKTTVLLEKRRGTCCVCFAGPLKRPAKHAYPVKRKHRDTTATYANSGMMILKNLVITAPIVASAVSVMVLGKTFITANIHRDCLDAHQKTSYKCPICNKSLANMESQFRSLDLSIQAQPMPEEFSGARAIVLCHDCSAKSSTLYHWLGLKCGVCQSYNTAQLQVIGLDNEILETDLVGRSTHVPGLTSSGYPNSATAGAGVRDMRRRHSSTATDSAFASAHINSFPSNRLARSVSPLPTPGRSLHASTVGGYFDLEEEDDGGDILGFWSRLPRSIASNDEEDDDDDDAAESSDEMTSDEDIDADEGDESEDDDFELLGHR